MQSKYNVFLITNGGDSLERLEDLKVNLEIIKGLKSKNPIAITKNINKIKNFIKENNIDIVHTHHRLTELLALQAINFITNNKPISVITVLSIVNKKFNVEYKSNKIIAVSNTIKQMLVEKFKIDEYNINVINNFTDTDEIHELEILTNTVRDHGSKFNILAIGRFHHEKNFETLLKALNILKNENIELILIGEGSKDAGYRSYISKNNLNVEIIVPQKNLIQYFLIADICVLPSSKDPFPNFMLQAGLHKVPFIGSNVDGISELICDGQNGLLFEAGNENELAEKILQFKENRIFAQKCAMNLYNDVINNYTQEFIIPKIEAVYNNSKN